METRKKLPLPAGGQAPKHKRTQFGALAAVALLIAGVAGYFLLYQTEEDFISTRAFLDGAPLEIRVNTPGRVDYVAEAGRPVAAGEVVLRMDTSEYENAIKNAETAVTNLASAIPERSRNLMLRYLAIPQTEQELLEALEKTLALEKTYKTALDDLSERQAVFSLELRRLELKREKLAEEEARMEAMRIEESLLRSNFNIAAEEFETASLKRASAEKRLRTKRELAQALRALPAVQQEDLQALESEFFKIYETERRIELAASTSPKGGRVMYAALSSGDVAGEGDLALYILTDEQPDIWVTAYFTPQAAKNIQPGLNCTVKVEDPAQLTLQGLVTERITGTEPDPSGDSAFKITFGELEAEQLIGIKPGHPVSVNLRN